MIVLKRKNNEKMKPFLKWVGGKTQILDKVLDKFPETMENYHEIFLGGGSVLIALLKMQQQGKITIRNKVYAYDINKSLISVYKHVQNDRERLFNCLTHVFNVYNSIDGTIVNRHPSNIEEAKTSKESYYYWIRNKFNTREKSTLKSSALFIFLNKTCFRGMYREGPNGYNVPYGHYKNVSVIDKEELYLISDLIKNVEFCECDFSESLKNVQKGDFVYLDPPYAPENEKSFVGYTNGGFSKENHLELFSQIQNIGCNFVMSNSSVPLVLDSFREYHIEKVITRRAINSKNPESTTTEVLISKIEK